MEIVTNPGVKYDSNVKSVLIIRTKRRGEGLAGVLSASGTQSKVTGRIDLDFIKIVKDWSFSLNVFNLLDSWNGYTRIESNGVSYYEKREAFPMVSLSVSYRFNKKKNYRGRSAAGAELNRL